MALYDEIEDDVFGGSSSKFLTPAKRKPRKTPSRQSIHIRRSSASLRNATNLAHDLDDDAANGMHSLAHELVFALMPEPDSGAKSLAAEFGIEYDDGAEGIDGQVHPIHHEDAGYVDVVGIDVYSEHDSGVQVQSVYMEPPDDELSTPKSHSSLRHQPEEDVFAILSRDMELTERFLNHLRQLDIESSSSSSAALERVAGDMIRRINDSTRDREGQLRELLECEREFRKIASEVGGSDLLGQLDELQAMDGLTESSFASTESKELQSGFTRIAHGKTILSQQPSLIDWEKDRHMDDEDEDGMSEPSSPTPLKESIPPPPPPPPVVGPVNVAKTIPHLVHMRALTTSLTSSLLTISEQAQENGTNNADAGRKIRALKNMLVGWKADLDSAEKSRVRIERWEAGYDDFEFVTGTPPRSRGMKRVDGRILVKEHLRAFEAALADAGVKTQAIMAVS